MRKLSNGAGARCRARVVFLRRRSVRRATRVRTKIAGKLQLVSCTPSTTTESSAWLILTILSPMSRKSSQHERKNRHLRNHVLKQRLRDFVRRPRLPPFTRILLPHSTKSHLAQPLARATFLEQEVRMEAPGVTQEED